MSTDYVHLMADAETLGLRRGAAVIEAAFVEFTEEGAGAAFSFWLDPWTQRDRWAMTIDDNVWKFWTEQPVEVSAVLDGPRSGQQLLQPHLLGPTLRERYRRRQIILWTRGPSFDVPILQELILRSTGYDAPWRFQDERCVRTFTAGVPAPEFEGDRHVALNDAMHQVRHMVAAEQMFPGNLARMAGGNAQHDAGGRSEANDD